MRRSSTAAALGAVAIMIGACGGNAAPSDAPGSPAGTASASTATTGRAAGTTLPTGTGDTAAGGTTTSTAGSTTSTGGSSTTSTAGTGISQADFVARAAAICATADTKISTELNTAKPTQAAFDRAIAAFKDFVAQLKALGIPAGKEQAAAQFYAAFDRLIADIEQLAPVVVSGDQATESSLEASFQPDSDAADAAAKALGLDDCFRSGGSGSSGGATGGGSVSGDR